MRSTLAWGPLPSLVARLYGWQARKRAPFAAGFHTYALEWTPDFVRAYVDSRLHAMLDLRVGDKGGFWAAGKFPATAVNGSAEVVVQDPYQGSASAPFDQSACHAFRVLDNMKYSGGRSLMPRARLLSHPRPRRRRHERVVPGQRRREDVVRRLC